MNLINNNEELIKIVDQLSKYEYIAVDTEFLRKSTYYSKLCLMQIAYGQDYCLIDPLNKEIDLTLLEKIFFAPNIIKVFHSARQDLEIIYNIFKKVCFPVFDTQIAACCLGFGGTISYEKLICNFFQAKINKKSQFSNWQKRPLSKTQLNYAIQDVLYLNKLYPILSKEIKEKSLQDKLDKNTKLLTQEENYSFLLENAWKRLNTGNLSSESLELLKNIASWREEYAQKLDLPRSHIMKDGAIYEIIKKLPSSEEELYSIELLDEDFIKNFGKDLLKLFKI